METDTHPILQRLLRRQAKSVPVEDGRKIVLVLFGGIMVGVRGAGALVALEELGLSGAFDEIYTMSAGFANTSYFLAGQAKTCAAAYYHEFSGRKFLNLLRPWEMANLDYLDEVVRKIRPIDLEKLFASRTKFYTMVTKLDDLDRGMFLDVHNFNPDDYFKLLRACSSLPIVAKGSVEINGARYRDVLYNNALKDFVNHVLSSDATDIIMIYNYDWQRFYTHTALPDFDKNRIYEFCPHFFAGKGEWLQKLTRFETRGEVLKRHCQEFGDEVKRTFGYNKSIRLL